MCRLDKHNNGRPKWINDYDPITIITYIYLLLPLLQLLPPHAPEEGVAEMLSVSALKHLNHSIMVVFGVLIRNQEKSYHHEIIPS